MAGPERFGHDLGDGPVGGHRVEGGHPLESHFGIVDPDTADAVLAPHQFAPGGTTHNDDHIAFAVGGAEQQDIGADEAGGDRHPVFRKIGDQRLRLGLGRCKAM